MVKPLVPPAVDVLGPYLSTPQSVNSRPGRTGDPAGAGFSWWKDCTDENAEDGTPIPAEALNNFKAQFVTLFQAAALQVDDDRLAAWAIQLGMNFAVATGTANAWVVDLPLAPLAYAAGLSLDIIAPATNTSTTVNANVSGLGNRRIKKADGTDPAIGDIVGGKAYATIDDGANIRILTSLASDLPSAGRTQIFTASGTFTVPSTQLEIWGIGAGGAGGCSGDGSGSGLAGNVGAGGGAGAFGYKRISGLTIGSTISVTIGAGGVPSTANPSGGGGSTSFGAHMTCGGGGGGSYGVTTSGSGGAGGNASGADVAVAGGAGGFAGPNVGGTPNYNDVVRIYGRGGMAPGGWGTVSWSGTGSAGQGYGSGGSGASGGSLILGGAGAPGLLIVRW